MAGGQQQASTYRHIQNCQKNTMYLGFYVLGLLQRFRSVLGIGHDMTCVMSEKFSILYLNNLSVITSTVVVLKYLYLAILAVCYNSFFFIEQYFKYTEHCTYFFTCYMQCVRKSSVCCYSFTHWCGVCVDVWCFIGRWLRCVYQHVCVSHTGAACAQWPPVNLRPATRHARCV